MLLYVDVNIDLVFCILGFGSLLCLFLIFFYFNFINAILNIQSSREISKMTTILLVSNILYPFATPPSIFKANLRHDLISSLKYLTGKGF